MTDIVKLLGDEAEKLLKHECRGIPKSRLHLPGADFVDRVVAQSDRRFVTTVENTGTPSFTSTPHLIQCWSDSSIISPA